MTKRVALYLRVSSSGQTIENQERELAAVAQRHGWDVVQVFADEGISGAKGRDQRPGFDALCNGVARRDFDMVAAWSVDRLGRSLQDLVVFLGELHGKRVDLYLHQQGLDTSTPAGRAMFQMLGVFAEFERAMIRERVNAGLARAKAQGKRLGRPPVADAKAGKVRAAKDKGLSVRQIAGKFGIGVGTVHRILSAA
ncbi:resolvase [Hypericibacter terrae]|uniref:Resolvase n=1 Tax=Hypericibacter terrae TaxID=2602015 RepID=A0A5J6MLD3_9PROT|nr:recombinase family protein [Hypericibacter terrae]QEX18041.1 resolvase [Hypericibacter terrae]